jgi:hypothetical protein
MSEKYPVDEQPWQPIIEGFDPFANNQNPATDSFPSSVMDALDDESDEVSRIGEHK